jgi:gamma-glutamyltranspeptidase/glutathione hydrolase
MNLGARALVLATLFVLGLVVAVPARALMDPFGGEEDAHSFDETYAHHAVAADHPLASEAGEAILESGGNAADAAVATALALGVVSSASSGLGGGGFALYYRASDHSLTFLDFRERAPAAATSAMFTRREGDDDAMAAQRSIVGGLAVGVPGEPAGLESILTRFGSGRVTRPAISRYAERLARGGWPASRYVANYSAPLAGSLANDPLLGSFLPAGGGAIPQGAMLHNAALARTLHEFGAHGARSFYRGAIARSIVREVIAHGGVMTAEDLAAYEVTERAPLRGTRYGLDIATAPPPSAGGMTMLASLAMLERIAPAPLHEGAALRHALAESWLGPYADRQRYSGDPDFSAIPLDALMADARIAARAALFDPWRARPMADFALPLTAEAPPPVEPGDDHGTSHLCVVDDEGNVMALTTTVNMPFGARFTAEGITLNDQMDDFAREVGEANGFGLVGGAPNLPGPGHRPVSTMSPTIVLQGGVPIFCVGGSGGSRIVTAVEQVLIFALLLDESAGDAVARGRVHHQGAPATLSTEIRLPADLVLALAARGHEMSAPVEGSANVQAIRIRRAPDGTITSLEAASDPRKDGEPRGR